MALTASNYYIMHKITLTNGAVTTSPALMARTFFCRWVSAVPVSTACVRTTSAEFNRHHRSIISICTSNRHYGQSPAEKDDKRCFCPQDHSTAAVPASCTNQSQPSLLYQTWLDVATPWADGGTGLNRPRWSEEEVPPSFLTKICIIN